MIHVTYALRSFNLNQHQLNMLSFLPVWFCLIKCTEWHHFAPNSPFIDDKVAFAGISTLSELLCCVDVGVDWDEGDDETQDPDADDEEYHNVATGKKNIFKSLEKVHNHPLLWLSRNHHARKEIKCKSKLFVCTSGYQWSSSPGKNIVLKKYFKNSWGKSIYGSWSCLSRFWILASRQNYCVTSREKTESNNILTPGL